MALPAAQFVQQAGVSHPTDGFLGSGVSLGINQYAQQLANVEGRKPTYRGGIIAFTPQATAQDFFTLTGSSLVVCRLLFAEIWIAATAACAMELQLVYNSAPDTGGTSTAPAAVPSDPNDAAAQCTLAAYTVAPTAGTTVGIVAAGRAEGPITTGAGNSNPLVGEFGVFNDKCPILRNANQQFALNNNGVALPSGLKMSIRFTWSEESLAGN
jgi:hypothetical protein